MMDRMERMAKLQDILRRQRDLRDRTSREGPNDALSQTQGLLLQYLKNELDRMPE
jgi:hypothetical protein